MIRPRMEGAGAQGFDTYWDHEVTLRAHCRNHNLFSFSTSERVRPHVDSTAMKKAVDSGSLEVLRSVERAKQVSADADLDAALKVGKGTARRSRSSLECEANLRARLNLPEADGSSLVASIPPCGDPLYAELHEAVSQKALQRHEDEIKKQNLAAVAIQLLWRLKMKKKAEAARERAMRRRASYAFSVNMAKELNKSLDAAEFQERKAA